MSQSTEKLLRIIRDGEQSRSPHRSGAESRSPAPALSHSGKGSFWSFRVPYFPGRFRRLGVDVRPRELQLALASESGSVPRLIGTRATAYPPGSSPGCPGFPAFLRREVTVLCGKLNDLRIWSHVFSTRIQLQHVLVPKVPSWEVHEIVAWRLKKQNPFDERDFLLDLEVQGQVEEKGVAKLRVLCCLVPREELKQIRGWFELAGIPLAGLTLASLALEQLFRSPIMPVQNRSYAALHLDSDWSRIDLFSGQGLTLSRVVKTGFRAMAEDVVQYLADQEGVAPSSEEETSSLHVMPELEISSRGIPSSAVAEKTNPDLETESRTFPSFANLSDGTPLSHQRSGLNDLDQREGGNKTKRSAVSLTAEQGMDLLEQVLVQGEAVGLDAVNSFRLTEAKAMHLMAPVCDRLFRQVERTFDFHVREQRQERPELLFISGDIAANSKFQASFERAVGLSVRPLAPHDPWSKTLGISSDTADATRTRNSMAFALATCDPNHTLNLLRSYEQRELARSESRVNMAVYAATICLLLFLTLAYALLGRGMKAKMEEMTGLDHQLAEYVPPVNAELLMFTAKQIHDHQEMLRAFSTRLEVPAMLQDILMRTPENIELFHLRIDSSPRPIEIGQRLSEPGSRRILVMDGVVQGDPQGHETALAGYIVALHRSALFQAPRVIDKRSEAGPDGQEQLRFVLQLEMIDPGSDATVLEEAAVFPGSGILSHQHREFFSGVHRYPSGSEAFS